MDPSSLIAHYGLLAVLLGSVLEGETLVLLAGYAAHRGYLDFLSVAAVSAVGAIAGDQFWFAMGRRHGARLVARQPRLAAPMARAVRLIEAHPRLVLLSLRFAWGLRIALPATIGMGRMSWLRFFSYNVLSALVWAPLVAGVGYVFGAVLSRSITNLHRVEHWAMLGIAATVLIAHLIRRRRRASAPPS